MKINIRPGLAALISLLLSISLYAQQEQVVRVTPGFATVIVCPVPPDLVTVGNVDGFSVQSAGNYVLIKPVVRQGTTNMFIKAGAESYNLLLQVANEPDLEVRLRSNAGPLQHIAPDEQPLTGATVGGDGSGTRAKSASSIQPQPLSSFDKKILAALYSRLKTNNHYTYSVSNSRITFAVDHMKQINNRLFVIATIVNNSNVPYDVGFVSFNAIDYQRSYLFWREKIKEAEMEPLNAYYNPTIRPHSTGRLLFVFDKHGYTEHSTLSIKCNEENGRRDLVLEVPGAMIE